MTYAIAHPRPRAARQTSWPRWLVRAEQVFVVFGVLMLQGFFVFVLAGNQEPDTIQDAAAGNPMVRLSWYPLYLMILGAIALRLKDYLISAPRMWSIWLLLLGTLISSAWSVEPDVTSRRAIALTFTALFGMYLALRGTWVSSFKLIGIALFIITLLNLAVIALVPGMGIEQELHVGAWKGITHEKNALGGDMARIALIFGALVHADKAHRRWWIAGLILSLLLVIGSTSTTALLAVLLPAAVFMVFLASRRLAATAIAAVYVAVVGTAAVVATLVLIPEQVVALFGKDLTFTGRTGIWEAAIRAISQRPLTGYGLGAFWNDPMGPSYYVREVLEWDVPSAHNAWLEQGLALGVPGMLMLALIVLTALIRTGLRLFTGKNPWPLLILLQMTLFSFSESAIFWHPNVLVSSMFIFMATLAFLPAEKMSLARRRV